MKRISHGAIEAALRAALKSAVFANECTWVSYVSLLGLVLSVATAMGSDWPGWRGPQANGIVSGASIALQWSTNQNILWQVEIPGAGWSLPVTGCCCGGWITSTASALPSETSSPEPTMSRI